MGLDNFQTDVTSHDYKRYGHHEYNEILESKIDEYRDRFPIDLDIEFVEVSPMMEKNNACVYYKEDCVFIRFSESFIGRGSDGLIFRTLLNCMVEIYCYRQGHEDIDRNKYFRWIVGRVGGGMSGRYNEEEWVDLLLPFLKELEDYYEDD